MISVICMVLKQPHCTRTKVIPPLAVRSDATTKNGASDRSNSSIWQNANSLLQYVNDALHEMNTSLLNWFNWIATTQFLLEASRTCARPSGLEIAEYLNFACAHFCENNCWSSWTVLMLILPQGDVEVEFSPWKPTRRVGYAGYYWISGV